ncbi:winged helix-turn-helix transcriptional regulator [Stakelama saccharophila]|uniref:Winged helix-turn-helix transcriptional regulator n=1 Tax=Stakelama saccharophila TaxID=3075605 RepID=A0ABZ0B7T7_9SPHN|nr:winged helix-turn-helix transcriptional regulator [Stakelama sp. W311]WNO53176.1 winged helix-turn-helix transcriptional regulator [Stakelama sp. W311]
METIGCEIKRHVDVITYKAFANALKRLKRNGLVTWTVLPTRPIWVENAITPLTHSLRVPFEALCAWALDQGPAVDAANAADDALRPREAA